MPLAEMIDHLVDPIVELKFAHPGLVSLVIGPHAALQIPTEVQTLLDESVLHLEKLWMRRFPHLNAETCHLYAVIFFQIGKPSSPWLSPLQRSLRNRSSKS